MEQRNTTWKRGHTSNEILTSKEKVESQRINGTAF